MTKVYYDKKEGVLVELECEGDIDVKRFTVIPYSASPEVSIGDFSILKVRNLIHIFFTKFNTPSLAATIKNIDKIR